MYREIRMYKNTSINVYETHCDPGFHLKLTNSLRNKIQIIMYIDYLEL